MRMICAVHYVPLPGGGLASPGEILEPEVAARFTDAQIAHLLSKGAILVEDAPAPGAAKPSEGAAEPDAAEPDLSASDAAEPSTKAPAPEFDAAPEIDAMDGIVADDRPKRRKKA